LEIVAGPVCADGQVWWQVNYQDQVGWTVEGRDDVYWLSMRAAAPIPPNLAELDDGNLSDAAEVSHSEANIAGAMALSPDGMTLAVLAGPGTNGVWLYDLTALDQLPDLLRGTSPLISIGYNPAGDTVVLGDNDGGVRVWSTDPQAAVLERWFDMANENATTAVAFSPDGAQIATAGDTAVTNVEGDPSNAILLWDLASVSQTMALMGHQSRVNALAYSPDGSMLASVSGDEDGLEYSVYLWDLEDGSVIDVLEEHLAPVEAVAFSPDGSLLASLDSSGVVILWELDEREFYSTLVNPGLVGRSLAFSPDGDLLAVGGGNSNDSGIRLWDVDDGQEAGILTGHSDTVGALVFSPDGTLLISASADKSLRFWGVAG
jgi:WD40 repeat protein